MMGLDWDIVPGLAVLLVPALLALWVRRRPPTEVYSLVPGDAPAARVSHVHRAYRVEAQERFDVVGLPRYARPVSR